MIVRARNQLGAFPRNLLRPLLVLGVEGEIERPVVVDQAHIAATLVGQGEDLGQVEEDVGVGVFQRDGNLRQGSLYRPGVDVAELALAGAGDDGEKVAGRERLCHGQPAARDQEINLDQVDPLCSQTMTLVQVLGQSARSLVRR